MNENQRHIEELVENFFYDCKENGTSDFEMWCEGNLENEYQKEMVDKIKDSVNTIAFILYE